MTTFADFAMAHPFIAIIAILTIVILIMAGLVSIAKKDSEPIDSAILGTIILWVCVGFGYLLSLGIVR